MERATFISAVLIVLMATACGGEPAVGSTPPGGATVENGPSSNPPAPGETTPDESIGTEQRLQQVLENFLAEEHLTGVTLAVKQGQKTLWTMAAGKSDVAAGTALKADDMMRIVELTEIYIATLVLKLEEESLLTLEDKLGKWVPDFPGAEEIPLYTLLNHTSGIYCMVGAGGATTAEGCLKIAATVGPSWEPGSRWFSSPVNYILLGKVIEAATGQQWYEALRERILYPYGLKQTHIEGQDDIADRVAKHYCRFDGKLKDVYDTVIPSAGGAAAGMVSSAADLASLFNFLHDGAILREESLEKMRDRHRMPLSEDEEYRQYLMPSATSLSAGLGFYVKEDGGESYFVHDGFFTGSTSHVSRRQRDGITVSVLVNYFCNKGGFWVPVPSHALARKVFALIP